MNHLAVILSEAKNDRAEMLSTFEACRVFVRIVKTLQPDLLPSYALLLVVYMQYANAAPGLSSSISRAAGVEQQLPFMLLVPGDVAVAEYDGAGVGKFLASYMGAGARVAQDVDDADATMAYQNFAFDGQGESDLFFLDVALHGLDGGDGFQFAYDREDGEVARV